MGVIAQQGPKAAEKVEAAVSEAYEQLLQARASVAEKEAAFVAANQTEGNLSPAPVQLDQDTSLARLLKQAEGSNQTHGHTQMGEVCSELRISQPTMPETSISELLRSQPQVAGQVLDAVGTSIIDIASVTEQQQQHLQQEQLLAVDWAAYQQAAQQAAEAESIQASLAHFAAQQSQASNDPVLASYLKGVGALADPIADPTALAEENVQIEQKWVGYLLGKGGTQCREIEIETSAQVRVDQGTRSLGYSTVRINGTVASVKAAKQRVHEILDKVGGMPGLNHTVQLCIEQRWVGWLLGARGSGIREIEAASGCKVSINQSTKALGYSVAQVTGSADQITIANELINDKLQRANPTGTSQTMDPSKVLPAAALAALEAGKM